MSWFACCYTLSVWPRRECANNQNDIKPIIQFFWSDGRCGGSPQCNWTLNKKKKTTIDACKKEQKYRMNKSKWIDEQRVQQRWKKNLMINCVRQPKWGRGVESAGIQDYVQWMWQTMFGLLLLELIVCNNGNRQRAPFFIRIFSFLSLLLPWNFRQFFFFEYAICNGLER